MDDRAAIEQCQAGNAEAFRYIVEKYQVQAMGHALAIVGIREDAEDAVQEAFLKAFRALRRFDARRRFYPWFYTILRNGCFNSLARWPRGRSQPCPTEILAVAPKPGEQHQDQLLRQALARLSADDRELITLKHLDGLSYQALAERLGIPAGTVMSRLYHARSALRHQVYRLSEEA